MTAPAAGEGAQAAPRWIGIAELVRRYGVARNSVWRWIRAGTFPRPAYFGARRAWLESELEAWAAERRARP